MARDDTLARSCGPGEGVVRFYQWALPTLSFGRNEPAVGRYPEEATLRTQGYDVVRRPTGGRVVLHHRELTYSVVAPIAGFDSLKAAYRTINAGLVQGLGRLGIPVRSAPPAPALAPDAGPCFRAPAEGEVMLHGRKLVGSAQVRVGDMLLQHGSILIDDDQHLLDELRSEPAATAGFAPTAERPARLRDALDPMPPVEEIISAVEAGLRSALPGDWRGDFDQDSLPTSTLEQRLAHYRSPEWTWRR